MLEDSPHSMQGGPHGVVCADPKVVGGGGGHLGLEPGPLRRGGWRVGRAGQLVAWPLARGLLSC